MRSVGADSRVASLSRLQSTKAGSSQTSHQPQKAPSGGFVEQSRKASPEADRAESFVQEDQCRAVAASGKVKHLERPATDLNLQPSVGGHGEFRVIGRTAIVTSTRAHSRS